MTMHVSYYVSSDVSERVGDKALANLYPCEHQLVICLQEIESDHNYAASSINLTVELN
jgi:hypothetical protein